MARSYPNLGLALAGLFKNAIPTFYDTHIRVPQNVIQKPGGFSVPFKNLLGSTSYAALLTHNLAALADGATGRQTAQMTCVCLRRTLTGS